MRRVRLGQDCPGKKLRSSVKTFWVQADLAIKQVVYSGELL